MINGDFLRRDRLIAIVRDNAADFVHRVTALVINREMRTGKEINSARIGNGFDLRVAARYVAIRNGNNPINRSAFGKSFKHAARIVRRFLPVRAEQLPINSHARRVREML